MKGRCVTLLLLLLASIYCLGCGGGESYFLPGGHREYLILKFVDPETSKSVGQEIARGKYKFHASELRGKTIKVAVDCWYRYINMKKAIVEKIPDGQEPVKNPSLRCEIRWGKDNAQVKAGANGVYDLIKIRDDLPEYVDGMLIFTVEGLTDDGHGGYYSGLGIAMSSGP